MTPPTSTLSGWLAFLFLAFLFLLSSGGGTGIEHETTSKSTVSSKTDVAADQECNSTRLPDCRSILSTKRPRDGPSLTFAITLAPHRAPVVTELPSTLDPGHRLPTVS